MAMIDHLSVGLPAFPAARGFDEALPGTLGGCRPACSERRAAYGAETVSFRRLVPFAGDAASAGHGARVAFRPGSREAVDARRARRRRR